LAEVPHLQIQKNAQSGTGIQACNLTNPTPSLHITECQRCFIGAKVNAIAHLLSVNNRNS